MPRKKRRRRKIELTVRCVPLRMYHDEEACRATILALRKGLRIAEAALRQLVSRRNNC